MTEVSRMAPPKEHQGLPAAIGSRERRGRVLPHKLQEAALPTRFQTLASRTV